VFPVVITAAAASFFKTQFRGEPVVFSDLLLLRESITIADKYPIDFKQFLLLPAITFIVLLIIPIFIKRIKINLVGRIVFIFAAAATVAVSFYTLVLPEDTFIEKNTHSSVWNLSTEYKNNGFVLGFFKSFKRSLLFAPKNYNEQTVKEYADELGYIGGGTQSLNMSYDELPNVIVIMNESYWDSDNLTGTRLNKDPMQSVRGLIENSGGISLLSSQSGGGTANVEYEFLTGKSLMYYPASAVVYQQYITKKQWSLAWYFRDLGYVTTAIHPYYDWFWRRNTVYPLLGFENIYFDKDMAYIEAVGQFISDMSLTKDIEHKYEKLSDGGGKPIFTFAVSMQNHGDYYDSRYPDREIRMAVPKDAETDAKVEVFF
jgi:phosphoglycerol transferase MdoB-like AlkP superfamily enzyme